MRKEYQTHRITTLHPMPSLDNTLFASVGAYSNPEVRCRNFMKSAEKCGVPLTWLSWGEPWQGFNHHKLHLLREQCPIWRDHGIKYVFMLDSNDVVFADGVDVVLRKAAEIYEPGTLLFNAEWDNHIYPYQNEQFREIVKQKGKHLNYGMIFGDIETYLTVIGLALDLMDDIKNGTPQAGLAELVYRDPAARHMWEDDQLSYQIASVYYPEYFRLDTDRYLFTWVGILDKPLDEMRRNAKGDGYQYIGQASLIHSSSTIKFGSQEKWDTWVRENGLVQPAMADAKPLKIKVCQFAYGDFLKPDHWFRFVEAVNRRYCEKHGYEYVVERLSEHGQADRHGNWVKVAHLKRCLNDCDYLFYLDADACFYCHEISIHEEILPLLPADKAILVPPDINGEKLRWYPEKLQSGLSLLRNCDIVHQILEEWDKVSDMPEYEYTRWEWPVEQMALTDYIYEKYRNDIQVHCEYYHLSSRYGYFVRHVAISSFEERYDEFARIFNRYQLSFVESEKEHVSTQSSIVR